MTMVDGGRLETTPDEDYPEAVAACLDENDKKAICEILGRSYLEPDIDLDLDDKNDEDEVSARDYSADDEREDTSYAAATY